MKRALLLMTMLLAVTAACSLERPSANEWGCTFGKGAWDSKGLKGRYAPGQDGDWTNDDFKTIPSDVRFYIIDNDPATADFGGRPIVVPAKGSTDTTTGVVPVSTEVQVRFVFNENACDWYVDHGLRSEPLNFNGDGDGDGWNQFLNTSMNQKLIEAARPVLVDEGYDVLYVNGNIEGGRAYDVLARTLSTNLSRELVADLGGDYFCGPSYEFDGKIDGVMENGCPPIEVTIKSIVPTEQRFVDRLETIVANEEEKKLIASNEERRLAEIATAQRQTIAETEAKQQEQLAEQERRENVETAKAQADLEIEQARQDVLEQQQVNADIQATSSTAFCRELAAVGVDCALYEAGKSGTYPRIILGDSADASILVGGDG